jgi:hypothetical protein
LPRTTTLVFRLSTPEAQRHLVRELSFHQDVVVRTVDSDEGPVIAVETAGDASTWEVRATVGAFDESAVEIEAQP